VPAASAGDELPAQRARPGGNLCRFASEPLPTLLFPPWTRQQTRQTRGMMMKTMTIAAPLLVAVLLAACGGTADQATETDRASAGRADADAQQIWWDQLQTLCGHAFAGEMVRFDPELDAGWLDRDVIMHVRECTPTEIRIPLHVGDNRSRTWVLTRTEQGILLKHDHRHPDGTEEASTQYGGHTIEAGTASRQEFPADDYSRNLFLSQDHPDGVNNRWAMELHPGERFTYQLTRPNRDFRADFDLTNPVAAPPPPWVIEPRR
jgi:hypothetical protein